MLPHSSAGISVGSAAASAILQNNSLRKSMPGSTSGLRNMKYDGV